MKFVRRSARYMKQGDKEKEDILMKLKTTAVTEDIKHQGECLWAGGMLEGFRKKSDDVDQGEKINMKSRREASIL
jgi:hypothetical protein